MSDRIQISKLNSLITQTIGLIVYAFNLMIFLFIVFDDFSLTGLFLLCLSVGIGFYLLIKTKNRNVYYEDGKIYLDSLFYREVYEISMFDRIRSTAFSGYSIRFKDGKEFYFNLLIEDLKLVFKADPDFYANELNRKLWDRVKAHRVKPNS